MIDRIRKGKNIARLLHYLFGPGKSDEHTDPHLVAGWRDQIENLEPPFTASGKRDIRRLASLLNAPLAAAGRPGQDDTVWHCVLSAAPADRPLSDEDWNAIATEFMHQMGLGRRDDPAGVRWVAVRHGLSKGGIDHIHIAATLARQDGQLPSVHNDFFRARSACREIERQFGLTVTAPADHTAAVRATRTETERAARSGWAEPPRIALRRTVQEVAAVAASEVDFFARLRDAGALIRERRSQTEPGRIIGYAVGLPGHTTPHGQPIWYSGGKLAPDLTLPRLRRRWERSGIADHVPRVIAADLSARSARAALRTAAVRAANQAQDQASYFRHLEDGGVLVRHRFSELNPGEITGYAVALPGHVDARGEQIWYGAGRLAPDLTLPRLRRRWGNGDPCSFPAVDPAEHRAIWDDIVRLTARGADQFRELISTDPVAAADVAGATADVLRTSVRAASGKAGRDLRRAADDFDRAAREAYGVVPSPAPPGETLRTVAQLLNVVASGRNPAVLVAVLAENLTQLVSATAELRQLQRRAHQATAASAAATRLCRVAAHPPKSAAPAFQQGRSTSQARRNIPG